MIVVFLGVVIGDLIVLKFNLGFVQTKSIKKIELVFVRVLKL